MTREQSAILIEREKVKALLRACELAREYRQAYRQNSVERREMREIGEKVDAALAAVGMPVEE